MRLETLSLSTASGRRVVAWHADPPEPLHPPVVVCSGFGMRMRHLGPVAAYLVRNGAPVYRFDPLDHVGLSDGDIRDFNLGAGLESLEAVVTAATSDREAPVVALIAFSLSALAAIHCAVRRPEVASVSCLVGVVHGRGTLARVFGADYVGYELDDLPELVELERKQVDPRPLWHENVADGLLELETTKRALTAVSVPVANVVAIDDDWVDGAEVIEAFRAPGGGPREVIELPYSGHELIRNPVALRLAMRHLTARATDADTDAISEPDFEELADIQVAERAREQAEAEQLASAGAAA